MTPYIKSTMKLTTTYMSVNMRVITDSVVKIVGLDGFDG